MSKIEHEELKRAIRKIIENLNIEWQSGSARYHYLARDTFKYKGTWYEHHVSIPDSAVRFYRITSHKIYESFPIGSVKFADANMFESIKALLDQSP